MFRFPVLFTIAILYLFSPAAGQQKMSVTVFDKATHNALPFVTVKFGETGRGTIGDLDGRFEILAIDTSGITWLEVSCLGYETKRMLLPLSVDNLYLQPSSHALKEVIVRPDKDKIRWILDNAIANKPNNNPDKYDWYRCKVYYKMLVDITLPDTAKKDTSSKRKKVREFLDRQHLLMSETYSRRTWKKPQQLQEEVLGSRFSGLKKSMFTGLVTDILPFHSYNNYINLNGKDYHNPLSKGYEDYYKFSLANQLIEGEDTVWELRFRPGHPNANDLNGTLYINSNGYAISNLVASATDTMLNRNVRLEQQYRLVKADGESHWFPAQLNYIIDWTQKSKTSCIKYYLKGNSLIDSVSFKEDKDFKFDKVHSVVMNAGSDVLTDSAWSALRPLSLDDKEKLTYRVIDSFGEKYHSDRIADYYSRAPESKVPIGIFDLDLKRLFSSNYYENLRLGLGGQTNEHLINWLSLGAWAGYGFGDAHWKYGMFGEVYLDQTHEFAIKGGYSSDISDPGRIRLNDEIDKNYLSYYLLSRVDKVNTSYLAIRKRFGYWSLDLGARQQQISPKYAYALAEGGHSFTTFTANEGYLGFRYAFAERTAPFYGRYYSNGSKYPIWYGKITTGIVQNNSLSVPYTQAITGTVWRKHLNRLGNESIMVKAGKSWSDGTLPLSKLFAGNGFRFDAGTFHVSYYAFGGLETMLPYGYYTDQFVNLIYRHDFDWKFYKYAFPGHSFSSAPSLGLQYGMLYGTLQNRTAQQLVAFSVPDNAYHEAGLLINNILRLNYYNAFYLTISAGYFYHIAPVGDLNANGKFVLGAGAEF